MIIIVIIIIIIIIIWITFRAGVKYSHLPSKASAGRSLLILLLYWNSSASFEVHTDSDDDVLRSSVFFYTIPITMTRSIMSRSYTSSPPLTPAWRVVGQLYFFYFYTTDNRLRQCKVISYRCKTLLCLKSIVVGKQIYLTGFICNLSTK
jgi:hypothetical protein